MWLLGGGEQLRCALIREAIHPDAAVALGAGPKPRDCLGAIFAFVTKGIEGALRAVTAADILNHDVVSVARKPKGMGIDHSRCDVSTVGLAHEEGRVRSISRSVVVV